MIDDAVDHDSTTDHDSPTDHDGPSDSDSGDDNGAGYIMATSALLMIPLMIFAALAVDVGSWYGEAAKIQRAADASALAGVPLLIDEAHAINVAQEVAARNGYTDQPGCDSLPCTAATYPQVVVTRIDVNQLRVDILNSAGMIFGQVVTSEPVEIHRSGVAEFAPVVPLGNPTSMMGGGTDSASGDYVSNYWLRAMADCEPRSTGDFIGAGGGCPNSNPNHRDEGHTFIIDLPVDGAYELQTRLTCAEFGGTQANASMRFKLFPVDTTPLNTTDDVSGSPLAELTVDRPSSSICPTNGSGWSPVYEPSPWVVISSISSAGQYVLQAKNPAPTSNVRSLYSLRVVPAGTTGSSSCSRIGPDGTSGCPNIVAKDYLTSYTHARMFPGGSIGRAELYLAEIEPFYAGKTLQVELFDPADGIDAVRIVDPQGNYVPFSWYTGDCAIYSYGCGKGDLGSKDAQITQTCSGDPCLKQQSGYSFQDRTVFLEIPLASDYECAAPSGQPTDCWWKVEYEDNNSNANETTTWGVTILGDPVHLIE